MGMSLSQLILRTDVAGMPLEWVDYRCAVRLYHTAQVAYECGRPLFRLRGGINAHTGARTVVEVSSIIATLGHGAAYPTRDAYTPPLNNHTLFRRDANLCLYCGEHFLVVDLSRDHVTPLSRGGRDAWTNVVTACRLSRSKPLPVLGVSEWNPCNLGWRRAFRTRSGYEFSLRVRRRPQ